MKPYKVEYNVLANMFVIYGPNYHQLGTFETYEAAEKAAAVLNAVAAAQEETDQSSGFYSPLSSYL